MVESRHRAPDEYRSNSDMIRRPRALVHGLEGGIPQQQTRRSLREPTQRAEADSEARCRIPPARESCSPQEHRQRENHQPSPSPRLEAFSGGIARLASQPRARLPLVAPTNANPVPERQPRRVRFARRFAALDECANLDHVWQSRTFRQSDPQSILATRHRKIRTPRRRWHPRETVRRSGFSQVPQRRNLLR
jgi:hypothetical protein